jgi:hypothetical protein
VCAKLIHYFCCTAHLSLQLQLLEQGRGPAAGHRSINLASTRLEEAQQWRAALQAAAASAGTAAATAGIAAGAAAGGAATTTSYSSSSVPWQGLTSSRSASNLFPGNNAGFSAAGAGSPMGRRGMLCAFYHCLCVERWCMCLKR